jgi:hypothetical protein
MCEEFILQLLVVVKILPRQLRASIDILYRHWNGKDSWPVILCLLFSACLSCCCFQREKWHSTHYGLNGWPCRHHSGHFKLRCVSCCHDNRGLAADRTAGQGAMESGQCWKNFFFLICKLRNHHFQICLCGYQINTFFFYYKHVILPSGNTTMLKWICENHWNTNP